MESDGAAGWFHGNPLDSIGAAGLFHRIPWESIGRATGWVPRRCVNTPRRDHRELPTMTTQSWPVGVPVGSALLTELIETLPLSRGSVFELIRALGITTIKSIPPEGKGRQAWVHPQDVPRLTQAAWDVNTGKTRIQDLKVRPSDSIGGRWSAAPPWQENHARVLAEILLVHLQEHGGGPAADRAIDALDGLLLDLHGATCWEEVA